MKIKKGKIILELIYNVFLWTVFYITTIESPDEQYAKSLFLYYIPIIYQEGFIIYNLLEEEKKNGRKNNVLFAINAVFVGFLSSRFIQALCYLAVEKNQKFLYTLGIAKFGFSVQREDIFLIILGSTVVVTFFNCSEE